MVPPGRHHARHPHGVKSDPRGVAPPLAKSPSPSRAWLVFAALLCVPPGALAWQSSLTADAPGSFPDLPPFQAEVRIGWSEIEAARAHAALTYHDDNVVVAAGGGTSGLARSLYQLDATLSGIADRRTLHTLRSDQIECYSSRILTTIIAGSNGSLSSLRESNPPGAKPAKWKPVKVAPVRDLFAGMLFIRSQPLATGDKVRLLIFPGGSAFLVDITALGPEKIAITGVARDAIKLDLKIQRVNTKAGNTLEPHSKFHSGTIWLTNDADRMLLRAEIDIFIGYVFIETVSFIKTTPPAP